MSSRFAISRPMGLAARVAVVALLVAAQRVLGWRLEHLLALGELAAAGGLARSLAQVSGVVLIGAPDVFLSLVP